MLRLSAGLRELVQQANRTAYKQGASLERLENLGPAVGVYAFPHVHVPAFTGFPLDVLAISAGNALYTGLVGVQLVVAALVLDVLVNRHFGVQGIATFILVWKFGDVHLGVGVVPVFARLQ